MRFKSSFSLYRRKVGSGKAVFYYRCYAENGKRVCGHSTGQTTKTAAREYCMRLMKDNKLVRNKYYGSMTFEEFADGFWDKKTSEYLNDLRSRKVISESYPDQAQLTTKNHLLPKFGDFRLESISEEMINGWLLSYPARKLSHATGNNAMKFLSIMLSWAVKKKILNVNPCKNVKFLMEEEKKRELLSKEDTKKLFGEEWEKYWGKYNYCLIAKLAACTGMRIGELVGLKGEFVANRGLIVNGQYGSKYGYTDTKNHKARSIPLSTRLIEELQELKRYNGDGFLFSSDGGEKPVSKRAVADAFSKALEKLGIDETERKKRGLTFHSWRHFFNTTLLLADVPVTKVQELVGHLSKKMTKRYTQIKSEDLKEITTVQDKMLNV